MADYVALLPRTPWQGPSASPVDASGLDLHRGVLVEPPSGVLRYELRVEPKAERPRDFPPLDVHDAGDGHLLMSERMVECLRTAGVDNIQFLPGEAVYMPTTETLSYQVGNIIGLVQALDVAASDCVVDDDGFVEMFYTLRLDEDRIAALDLFRMYESFHTIIVSGRVKRALEAHGITGIQFMSEEDWEPGTIG
jgi:hypothetical protein